MKGEPIPVKGSEKASWMSCSVIRDLKNERELAGQNMCGNECGSFDKPCEDWSAGA